MRVSSSGLAVGRHRYTHILDASGQSRARLSCAVACGESRSRINCVRMLNFECVGQGKATASVAATLSVDFDVGVGSLAGSSKFILASEDGSLKFWDANVGCLFTQVG